METSSADAEVKDTLIESADYNVLSRPPELVESQKSSSSRKKFGDVFCDEGNLSAEYYPILRSQIIAAPHFKSSRTKSKSGHEKTTSSDGKKKPVRKSTEKLSKEKFLRNKLVKKALNSLKSNTAADVVSVKELKAERSKMLNENFDSYLKKAQKSVKTSGYSYSPKSDGTAKDNLESSNKQQYENSLLKPAFTAQERYDILNARDKLIRLNDTNKGDSEVKKISGTCPDMCPEKERYSRIAKNCLSILETEKALNSSSTSKEVNHQYMVKEYSRSSADQQEPLPNELRPVSVLKFTMDYLICNIIDKPATHLSKADWFDFIWNRTRSIRKDITQQQLCDPDSVEIIEKCVRFHIYCAEALSEEDTATFDPKINNENLTKSLQTLKHMYYDLQTRGIKCPNEAEFRAYDILLSLTEGETLRLVKDIHKDIVKSPDLKFAFNAALAFESNNYVKFFKLFEKASFLNSCILHRYINEARIRAIQSIIRAYSTASYSILYPLANLVRDLKFENVLEAANFCQWHGLTTDDLFVTIERQTFSRPSSVFPVTRSPTLVNNKLKSGLGEAINKGPLNQNPLMWYKPLNSFNHEGLLRDEGLLQDDSFSFESNQSIDEDFVEDMDQDIEEVKDTREKILPVKATANENSDKDTRVAFFPAKISADENNLKDVKKAFLPSKISVNEEKTSVLNSRNEKDAEKSKTFSFKTNTQDSNWTSKSFMSLQKQPQSTNSGIHQSSISKAPAVSISSAEDFAAVQPSRSSSNPMISNTFSFKDFSTPKKPVESTPQKMFTQKKSVTEKSFFAPAKELRPSLPVSQFSSSPFNRTDPTRDRHRAVGQVPHEKSITFTANQSKPNMNRTLPRSPVSSSPPQVITRPIQQLQQRSTVKPLQQTSSFKQLQQTSSVRPLQQPSSAKTLPQISSVIPHLQTLNSISPMQKTNSKSSEVKISSVLPFSKLIKDNTAGVINDKEVMEASTVFSSGKNETDDQKIAELDFTENSDSYGISSGEDEEVLLKLKAETEAALIADVSDEVYTQCIEEISSTICEEIIAEEWSYKRKRDEELAMMQKQIVMGTVYKWKLYCQRKKQRKIIEDFEPSSSWVPMLMNSEYVSSGATSPFTTYKTHCSVSRLADSKIEQRKQKVGWEPLDDKSFSSVSKLADFPPAYLKNTGITQYFKLGILFINYGDDKLSTLLEWLSAKLKLTPIPNSSGRNNLLSFYVLNVGTTLVSIECAVFDSSSTTELDDFLLGVSGIILFSPAKFPHQVHFNAALRWLHTVFDDKNLPHPFPLFTYFLDSSEKCHIVNQLVSFLDGRLHLGQNFSTVKIGEMPTGQNYTQYTTQLENAIKWVVENVEQPPKINSCSFRDYLEDSFASAFDTLFWKLTLTDFKLLMQVPQEMITFYNDVMKTRGTLLTSNFLAQVLEFWPPKELFMLQPDFKFIDIDFQKKCEAFIDDLCLPLFTGDPMNTADIWMYLNDITDPLDKNKELLLLSIRNLLEKDSSNSWPHIISKCAYYLICNKFSTFDEFLDKEVYFMQNDLEAVDFDRYWQLLSISLEKKRQIIMKRKRFQKSYRRVSKFLKSSSTSFDFQTPESVKRSKTDIFSNSTAIADSATCKVSNMLQSLQKAMKEQSLESEKFSQMLNESTGCDTPSKGNQIDHTIIENNNSTHLFSGRSSSYPPPSESSIPCEEFSVTFHSETNSKENTIYNVSCDWRTLVGQPTSSFEYTSPSSISEKLAELKYNIQRNKLLEDNLSELLNS